MTCFRLCFFGWLLQKWYYVFLIVAYNGHKISICPITNDVWYLYKGDNCQAFILKNIIILPFVINRYFVGSCSEIT